MSLYFEIETLFYKSVKHQHNNLSFTPIHCNLYKLFRFEWFSKSVIRTCMIHPTGYLSIQFRIEKRNILKQKEKFQDKTPILQDNTNNSRTIIISFPGVQFIIFCSYALNELVSAHFFTLILKNLTNKWHPGRNLLLWFIITDSCQTHWQHHIKTYFE